VTSSLFSLLSYFHTKQEHSLGWIIDRIIIIIESNKLLVKYDFLRDPRGHRGNFEECSFSTTK
jgi:hypothetical protein